MIVNLKSKALSHEQIIRLFFTLWWAVCITFNIVSVYRNKNIIYYSKWTPQQSQMTKTIIKYQMKASVFPNIKIMTLTEAKINHLIIWAPMKGWAYSLRNVQMFKFWTQWQKAILIITYHQLIPTLASFRVRCQLNQDQWTLILAKCLLYCSSNFVKNVLF